LTRRSSSEAWQPLVAEALPAVTLGFPLGPPSSHAVSSLLQ
jgi:hypothetical protein